MGGLTTGMPNISQFVSGTHYKHYFMNQDDANENQQYMFSCRNKYRKKIPILLVKKSITLESCVVSLIYIIGFL